MEEINVSSCPTCRSPVSKKLSVCPNCYAAIVHTVSKPTGSAAATISPVAGGIRYLVPALFVCTVCVGGVALWKYNRGFQSVGPVLASSPLPPEFDATKELAQLLNTARQSLANGNPADAKDLATQLLPGLRQYGEPLEVLACHKILAESSAQLGQIMEALEEYRWLLVNDPQGQALYAQKVHELQVALQKHTVVALQQLHQQPPGSKPQELSALQAWLDTIYQYGLLKDASAENRALVLGAYARAATLSCDLRDVQGARLLLERSKPFGKIDESLRKRVEQSGQMATKDKNSPLIPLAASKSGERQSDRPKDTQSSSSVSVDANSGYPMASKGNDRKERPAQYQLVMTPSGPKLMERQPSDSKKRQPPKNPPAPTRPGAAPAGAPPTTPMANQSIKLPEIKLPNQAADSLPTYHQHSGDNSIPGYYKPSNARDSLPGY